MKTAKPEVFMMMRKVMCLLSALVLFSACARNDGETSNLQVSLPVSLSKAGISQSLSAQSYLAHVIVNITGTGLNDAILKSWDACKDCLTQTAIPSTLPIEGVPSGGAIRLVQVLAVYKDSNTGEMSFYYGDLEKALSAAEENVSIDLTAMGVSSTTVTGRVSGRYLTGVDSGPTSKIDIKFDPAKTGRPALTIEESVMVNGWFNVFMMTGLNFAYVLHNTGEVMWGQSVNLESTMFDPGYSAGVDFDHLMKAFIPVNTTYEYRNGSNVYKNEEPSIFVWGYWNAPGYSGNASSKKICTPYLSTNTTKLKVYSSDPNSYATSSYLSYGRRLTYLGAVPTPAQLLDTTAPQTELVVKGGANMTGSCGGFANDAINPYLNFMKVSEYMLDGNGNDRAAGFSGIYRNNANNTALTVSGAPVQLMGQVLPGVESVFSQIKVFKRAGSEDFRLERPSCLDSALIQNGYVSAGTAASISSDGSFSVSTDITTAQSSSGVSAIFCPVTAAGVVAPTGHFFSIYELGYGFGGL
jgi:hypothetical protein